MHVAKRFRLHPLMMHYEQRSPVLTFRLGVFHTILILVTALTTGLALTSSRLWVPLVVAIGAAATTTIEWEQLQNRLRNVNQCLEDLQVSRCSETRNQDFVAIRVHRSLYW